MPCLQSERGKKVQLELISSRDEFHLKWKKYLSQKLKLSLKSWNSFSLLLSRSQLPLLCVAPSPSLSLRRNFLSLAPMVTRTPSDLIRSPASLSHSRDGRGFGLPISWWGLGNGVASVVVVAMGGQLVETLFSLSSSQSLLAGIKTLRSSPWVANIDVVYGGQSGCWVLRWRRCLGWGLVDTVVWGLRFGIWVAPPPTVKWVWALGFGFLRQKNGFGWWDVEVCFCWLIFCYVRMFESNGFWVCCCELNLYIVAAFGFLIC